MFGPARRAALAGTLIASLILVSLGLSASATAKTTVGVADQTADTFADPLFGSLGIKHARLNLAWDAFEHDWQVADLDQWMAGARSAGVAPLVILSQSRVAGRTRVLPTPAQYRKTVQTLRARYPFVREIAGWNEMNYPGQPTFRKPKAVAQYYKILRKECRGCSVLPGSLLDNPNMVRWAGRLRAEIRKLGQPDPKLGASQLLGRQPAARHVDKGAAARRQGQGVADRDGWSGLRDQSDRLQVPSG